VGDFSASREILYASDAKIVATRRDFLDEKLRLTAVTLTKHPDKKVAIEGDETGELDTPQATSLATKSVVFAPWEPKNWCSLAFTRMQSDQTSS
jgi:hypothetical protein